MRTVINLLATDAIGHQGSSQKSLKVLQVGQSRADSEVAANQSFGAEPGPGTEIPAVGCSIEANPTVGMKLPEIKQYRTAGKAGKKTKFVQLISTSEVARAKEFGSNKNLQGGNLAGRKDRRDEIQRDVDFVVGGFSHDTSLFDKAFDGSKQVVNLLGVVIPGATDFSRM